MESEATARAPTTETAETTETTETAAPIVAAMHAHVATGADGGTQNAAQNLSDESASIEGRASIAALDAFAEQVAMRASKSGLVGGAPAIDRSLDDRARDLTLQADVAIRAAIAALREALIVRPGDHAVLHRLRALHEAAGDHSATLDVRVAIAESIVEPAARARAFVVAAECAAKLVGNIGRAVALYEAAIADDPAVAGAFEATLEVLVGDGDWRGVAAAYVRQIERLSRRAQSTEAIAHTLERLAAVRAEKLGDKAGAIQALDKVVALRPTSLEARARLAALLEENGQDALTAQCLEAMMHLAPTRAETLKSLHRLHVRRHETDRAYAAAMGLVYLGEADDDARALFHQHSPRGLLAPTHGFDAATWALLTPDDHPREVADLIAAIAPAAIALKIDALKASGQLPRLDPRKRQNPEKSTVAAVRTVGWAARLIGVKVPDIYAHSDAGELLSIVPALEPGIVLGRPLLSGRALPELAFLLSSELAHQRLTSRLLSLYPTIQELGTLVLAGATLAMTRTTRDSFGADLAQLAGGLAKRLDATSTARLEAAVARQHDTGAPFDLLAWLRSTERTACRAGLIACGDLNLAARLVASDGRAGGGLSVAERVSDLLVFSASKKFSTIRTQLGIAARGSIGAKSADASQEMPMIDIEVDES